MNLWVQGARNEQLRYFLEREIFKSHVLFLDFFRVGPLVVLQIKQKLDGMITLVYIFKDNIKHTNMTGRKLVAVNKK